MQALFQKTGGFIKGVCHPGENAQAVAGAGFGWVRMDVPWQGTPGYRAFRERVAAWHRAGVRALLISPYPDRFISHGIDVTAPEGLREATRLCASVAADFAPFSPCWQATNEMHIAHFRAPLNHEQAVKFLAACVEGLRAGDPRAAVGHNSVSEEWLPYAKQVVEATGDMDYTGVDLYAGTWEAGGADTYLDTIDRLYAAFRRPVVLMEFGFASAGECMKSDLSDVRDALRDMGFAGIEDALANIDCLAEKLPPVLSKIVLSAPPEERRGALLPLFPHYMKKWPCAGSHPHTEAGQADFYRELLPRLLTHPRLGGFSIYCMRDAEKCFLCGEQDCPTETAWGLLRADGTEKPAYKAVSKLLRGGQDAEA